MNLSGGSPADAAVAAIELAKWNIKRPLDLEPRERFILPLQQRMSMNGAAAVVR
ncbi:MAG: hypothetical protein IT424_04650 [Pirellulales bacterium]|nr:hypothetical protein [Pirellulales bacterium]